MFASDKKNLKIQLYEKINFVNDCYLSPLVAKAPKAGCRQTQSPRQNKAAFVS